MQKIVYNPPKLVTMLRKDEKQTRYDDSLYLLYTESEKMFTWKPLISDDFNSFGGKPHIAYKKVWRYFDAGDFTDRRVISNQEFVAAPQFYTPIRTVCFDKKSIFASKVIMDVYAENETHLQGIISYPAVRPFGYVKLNIVTKRNYEIFTPATHPEKFII